MTSSWGGPLEFPNIQEIVEIELMFELICMFVYFSVFLSSLQMIRKEETNNKTGESTKLLLYSSKTHVNSNLLFYQFISNIQEIIDIEWLFELICMFFVFLSSLQMIRKRGNNSKTGESSKLLLYYCAIVKYMCLFFDQLTSYLPNQVSRWPFIVLESMVPLIAWHSAQT